MEGGRNKYNEGGVPEGTGSERHGGMGLLGHRAVGLRGLRGRGRGEGRRDRAEAEVQGPFV